MLIHALFDGVAFVCAFLFARWFRQKHQLKPVVGRLPDVAAYHYYLLCLILGLVLGSIGLGSANLWLSGEQGLAKSMLGGIVGAIVGAELFKGIYGIRHSTGLYFVPALIVLIGVGRIGCFLTGLDDFTYGVPTQLPWGVDFGDGVMRHPVQLYETGVMLVLCVVLVRCYPKASVQWQRFGFYWFILVYALQRFGWEFLKPYGVILGGLNLFQWLCLGLIGYACMQVFWQRHYYND